MVAWATVLGTEAYYADGSSGLVTTIHEALGEALDIVDDSVNFSEFDQDNDGYIDAVTFLHSGYGAEWGGTDAYGADYTNRIWSHKWALYSLPGGSWLSKEGVKVYNYHISPGLWGTSGSTIGRVGVIAHETGHFLGLPDLYDTDNTPGNGIGSWGLMANSWGGDGSQQPPPLMSPWSKIQLGWVTPVDLWTPGNYSVGDSLNSSQVYMVTDGFPFNEYLLIENRQRKDAGNDVVDNIPTSGDGLVIWHIDDASDYNTQGYPGQGGWPENGNHYRVAVLQADGDYDLEKGINRGDSGDAYRAGFVDAIGPSTMPNTDAYQQGSNYATGHEITFIGAAGATMSFDFNADQVPTEPPVAPSGLTATATGHYSIDLSWTDNSGNENGFDLERQGGGSSWAVIAQLGPNATSYSDNGLTEGTIYEYRVLAQNIAGESDYSNTASATTTVPVPPTAPTNLVATAVSQYRIDLSWTDGTNETALEVQRSAGGSAFMSIASLSADITAYSDTGLSPSTTYTYKVVATNEDGPAESNPASAITKAPPPQAYAMSESTVFGTVLGSLDQTLLNDGDEEAITEVTSVPNKNARSQLEHVWQVGPVNGGAQVTLTVKARGSDNSEGDSFEFSYSTNGGVSYTPVLIADGTTQTVDLPPETSGTVYLRVQDTDRTKGNVLLDTVYVDYIMIESFGEIVLSAPTNLGGSAVSSSEITLTWEDVGGETGYTVEYQENGTNTWSIATSSLSANSTDSSITTLDEGTQPLFLSASGYKVKGVHHVDLIWSGGSTYSATASMLIWGAMEPTPTTSV